MLIVRDNSRLLIRATIKIIGNKMVWVAFKKYCLKVFAVFSEITLMTSGIFYNEQMTSKKFCFQT